MSKKFDWRSLLVNFLLAFLIGLCGAGCLCTAFHLDVAAGNVLLTCLFWAVASTILPRLRHGTWYLLGLILLCGLYYWKADMIYDGARLLNVLFSYYGRAYGWSVPDFVRHVEGTQVTLAVSCLAAICTMLAGLFLRIQRGAGAIFAAALPLIPCLIVTDTIPAPLWMFVLIMCVFLLLLSQLVRRTDPKRADRLVIFLLIPILLCGGLLFARYPQNDYQNADDPEKFTGKLMHMIDRLPLLTVDENGQISMDFDDLPEFTMPTILVDPNVPFVPTISLPDDFTLPTDITIDPGILDIFQDQVSLGNAGPRDPGNGKVMTVIARMSGTLYLRERGYDIYTGTTWGRTESPQELEMDLGYVSNRLTVTIQTVRKHGSYFVPYYTYTDPTSLQEGWLSNPSGDTSYSFQTYPLAYGWQSLWKQRVNLPIWQIEQHSEYLLLPEDTRRAALEILQELGVDSQMDVVSAAELIRLYVRNSATYDLNTPSMPKDQTDFAIWFLTESETGYCIHFATAAAVLLRAAGIPARYVEGYMAPITGNSTSVTADLAHAWVEYYVPEMGWVVLEATPGYADTPEPPVTEPTVPDTLPTLPTTPTEPTTAPPDFPTLPTTPDLPTLPPTSTGPEDTTAPTPPTTVPPETTLPGSTGVPPTSSSAPPATTEPVAPPEPVQRPGLWAALSAIFGLLTVACALIGQWQLRLWLKLQWLQRGDNNRQALKLWRECRRLAKLRRQKAPYALRDLAWKAKFSQHTITDEELQEFHAYLSRSIEHLQKRPWFLRLVYRLIFAAY